jgi:hypothetical protein
MRRSLAVGQMSALFAGEAFRTVYPRLGRWRKGIQNDI